MDTTQLTPDEEEALRLRWSGLPQAEIGRKLGYSRAHARNLLASGFHKVRKRLPGVQLRDVLATVVEGKTQEEAGEEQGKTQQAVQDAQARARRDNAAVGRVIDEFKGAHKREPDPQVKPLTAEDLAEAERRDLQKLARWMARGRVRWLTEVRGRSRWEYDVRNAFDDFFQSAWLAGALALQEDPQIPEKELRGVMYKATRPCIAISGDHGSIDGKARTETAWQADFEQSFGVSSVASSVGGLTKVRPTMPRWLQHTIEGSAKEFTDAPDVGRGFWDVVGERPDTETERDFGRPSIEKVHKATIRPERLWIWQPRRRILSPDRTVFEAEPSRLGDASRAKEQQREYPAMFTCRNCGAEVPAYYCDPWRPDVCFDCWGPRWRRQCVRHTRMVDKKPSFRGPRKVKREQKKPEPALAGC